MKKFFAAFLAVFALTLVMNVMHANAQEPPCCYGWSSFQIYGPWEGQQFTQGDRVHFDFYWGYDTDGWYCGTGQTKIALWYSSDYGNSWTAIDEKIDWYTTGYDWTIPKSAPAQYGYIVRVQEVPDQNNCLSCALNCEAYTSTFEVLKGCFPPTITSFVPDQNICANSAFTMTVGSDASNPTCTWRKNGVTVATTYGNSYTLNPVKTTDGGLWDVVVTDECGATSTSGPTNLTVVYAPVITAQSSSTGVCQGQDAVLSVRATGDSKTFQWRKNGVNISGARDSNYVIQNATASTADGTYDCVVSGTCSPSATTTPIVVTTLAPPTVIANPSDQTVCLGAPVTLTFSANGGALSYAWFKNGVSIAGATSSTYTIPSMTDGDVGKYQCVATASGPNPQGCNVSARSREVMVSRFNTPSIMSQPKATDGCLGGDASLTVAVDGFDVSYQWYKDGVALPNTNSNTLSLLSLTPAQAGNYAVRVSGTCGFSVMSSTVPLNVLKQPTIVTGPSDANLTLGDPLTLTVAGTDVRTIKWLKNNVVIPNMGGSTFSIASVSMKDAGVYSAVLTNSCGSVTTGYAVVKVTDPASLVPELTVSQLNVDAGDVPVEYSRTVSLTNFITNTGKAPLTVTSIRVTNPAGTGTFAIATGGATPFTLAPGETHSIGITFDAPQTGASTASLVISSNTPGGDMTVGLSGRGVLRYTVPQNLDFAKVIISNSAQNCANVMNTSSMSITLDQALISGTDASMFTIQSALPITIAAGSSAQICVKFTPTTLGDKTGTLTVHSSDGGNTSFSLTGNGDDPTGVIEVAGTAELNAYPNPSNGRVSFAGTMLTLGSTVTIVNSVGTTVASLSCSNEAGGLQWADDSVASGTYTVIVRNGNTVRTLPIAIVR